MSLTLEQFLEQLKDNKPLVLVSQRRGLRSYPPESRQGRLVFSRNPRSVVGVYYDVTLDQLQNDLQQHQDDSYR